jgi:Na+-transporting methylmalonyl-CoA/oxaloacetate decarboxylase gamma subunit
MSDISALRSLGHRMQIILVVGVMPILVAALWYLGGLVLDPAAYEASVAQLARIEGPVALSQPAVWAVAVLALIQLSLLVAALYCVWRMFGAFAAEEPLSVEPALWMRRAGFGFVAVALGGIVLRSAAVVALTLGNPPGQRMLSFSIGSAELHTLLIACIMYMMARVTAVAAEVRADQKGFV